MRIALAQLNPTIGALAANAARIADCYSEARQGGAGLVVCTELALWGYPPRDLLLHKKLLDLEQTLVEGELANLTAGGGPPLLLGACHRHGGRLYNAALILEGGAVREVHCKTLLPFFDVFDEQRYFSACSRRRPASLGGMLTAVTICEDIWNDSDFLEHPLYDCNPLENLFGQGARFMLNLSASPYHRGKQHLREEMLSFLAKKYQAGMIYLNQVGGNDELIFDGTSLVFNASGQLLYRAACCEEELFYVDSEDLFSPQKEEPPARGLDDLHTLRCLLELGLRDYVRKSGFHRVILGLSGGVDSALVATLAVGALGRENVLGVMMPSPYSAPESLQDATILAENLGCPYRVVEINRPLEVFLDLLNEGENPLGDLAEENLQARLRSNIIMHLSNREGYLPLATGNKSELAVGYCTLYGDMAGGLAPIADLPKLLVYELAEEINASAGRDIIPRRTLTRAPSAELRPDQKDEDSLPPYTLLDPILQHYIEENLSEEEIAARGFPADVVREVASLVDRAEYKRRQAAPGLRVTTRAFGSGRRMPLARSYQPWKR